MQVFNIAKWESPARKLFSRMISSVTLALNSNMKQLIDSGQYQKALDLFYVKHQEANEVTFNLALKTCTKLKNFERGESICQQLSPKLLNNPFIQPSLIHFYMECGKVEQAEQIFNNLRRRTDVLHGAMMKGYISNKLPEKALHLYQAVQDKPNSILINIALSACSKLSTDHALKVGRQLIAKVVANFKNDEILNNSAIDTLMKFGDVQEAENLFSRIPKKNIIAYGAMMQGFVKNNLSEKALDLFEVFPFEPNQRIYSIIYSACASLANERALRIGKQLMNNMPNSFYNENVVVASLLHMVISFGQFERAETIFRRIKRPTTSIYATLMTGYKIQNKPSRCLQIFDQMQRTNTSIDDGIAFLLINACSMIGLQSTCCRVVEKIPKIFLDDPRMKNCLMDMWGKCGDINQAKQLFVSIENPNTCSYNTMINIYGRNGMATEAIELYQTMPADIRDQRTYVCVINACSHAGLTTDARSIFEQIQIRDAHVVTTMVDCYSRVGLFGEAQELIDSFERSSPPSLIMYMAVLSGARNHRRVNLAQKIYERMQSLFGDKRDQLVSASILLSNTYLSVGDQEQAFKIRFERMNKYGEKVEPGLSWTEVDGQLVEFRAHDNSHPRSKEIYAELDRLADELQRSGHHFNAAWVTRPLRDDETIESVLCGHSEKLALAFNFIQQRVPSVIQITKNLRVCGDCHRALSVIAKIRQCEIIVRDANRMHYFHLSGQCSCQDHF